jgi:ribosomal RNA-processing protein 1
MSLVHSPDQDQVKLARALVSPDKSVRDKTCATLASYLSATTSMTDMEMLKFWKALYFTVWLSDKAAVQLELTQNISKLLTSCSKKSLKIQFVRMYFRTLQREWLHLDQYRIDKFYKLTRFLLRESLIYLHSKGWPAKLSEELLGAIEDESLTKTPNGIRFHLADIYLDELYTATNGELSNTQFLVALRPFLRALGKATDGTFLERVNKRVVGDYLVRYARERPIVEGEDGSGAKFSSVNTQVLQASVFDIASEESTLERNRKLLYALHKAFPEVTKVQFADIDMNDLAAMDSIVDTQSHGHEHGRNTSTGTDSGTGTGSSGKEPAVATTQAGKKKGKKQGKIADAMADVDAENATETHHKANKKRTAGELGGDHVSTTAAETAAASTSGVKAKKQKVAPRDEGDEGASAKKGVCAPASSAADEIDNLFDKTTRNGGKNKKASIADNGDRGSQSDAAASKELPSAPAPAPAQFIKAKKFAGAKPGYVFKKVSRLLHGSLFVYVFMCLDEQIDTKVRIKKPYDS